MVEMHWSFPPNSWEDLHRFYGQSVYTEFPIRHYHHFFCQLLTSSSSAFTKYPRLVTFHLNRWLWVWPHCPGSKSYHNAATWAGETLGNRSMMMMRLG